MTLPAVPPKVKSVSDLLDPDLCAELQASSRLLDAAQFEADNSQWDIARRTNEMWPEHKNLFDDKLAYLAECSRVANIGLKHKRFSDSGETLRRWCEVQAAYANFSQVDLFLDELSFDHLYRAKRLQSKEKLNGKPPVYALAMAAAEKWTAEEMYNHFDPPTKPSAYDLVTGWLDGLLNINSWKWLKSADTKKGVLYHANEIKRLIAEDK